MAEHIQVLVPEEVSSFTHNSPDRQLNQDLYDYDQTRNIVTPLILIGIGLVGSASKIPVPEKGFSTEDYYILGSILISFGYLVMELCRRNSREIVMEAKSRGLKVVKGMFTRKVERELPEAS